VSRNYATDWALAEAAASGDFTELFKKWDAEARARPAAVVAVAAPAAPRAHPSEVMQTCVEEAFHALLAWARLGPAAVRGVHINADGSGSADIDFAGASTAVRGAIAAIGELARERYAVRDAAFARPPGRPWVAPAARGGSSAGDRACLERLQGRGVTMEQWGVERCEARPFFDEHWGVGLKVAEELKGRFDKGQCETSGAEFGVIVEKHWYRPRGN
jgi:hypothetical protein